MSLPAGSSTSQPTSQARTSRAIGSGQSIRRTARTTGALYLALGVAGILGFLLIRPQLYAPGDPTATLNNLVDNQGLARVGVVLEMGIVVAQALTALWFYRLFRSVDAFAAGALAAFGMVNAVAILGSAAFLATAAQIAAKPLEDAAANVQLAYIVSENLWGLGALFFGLWLIPMGACVLRAKAMPRTLGWILIVGGAGYLVNAFVTYLATDLDAIAGVLVVPANIGEFWMIAYLLFRGINQTAIASGTVSDSAPEAATAQ